MAANHSGFLVQGHHGAIGNFEGVAPRAGGGVTHVWRDNNAPGFPWHGPALAFGSAEDMHAVATLMSTFGHLEVVALEGNKLFHNWRDDGGSWHWQGRTYLPGANSVVGAPAFVQGTHGGNGNFEVVAPVAGGGLAHWWRDNDDPAWTWHGPGHFGGGPASAASMIFSTLGNLHLVVVVGSQLVHYSRDDGGTWAWSGPALVANGVSGAPALVQASHGAVGNFEVVAPMAAGSLAHFWRDNDDPALPWSGPTHFGSGTIDAVGLVHSSFGNLELVARSGAQLAHYWRDDGTTWAWHGPFPFADDVPGNPSAKGECSIPYAPPIVGIHAALVRTGNVLLFGYSDFDEHVAVSGVLDPTTGALQVPPDSHHVFCSGHTFLSDGRLCVAGGHHHDVAGLHIFDPEPGELAWSHPTDMAAGRWYPTCTTLPNGNTFIISGTVNGGPVTPQSPVNNTVEIYDPNVGFGPLLPIPSPFSVFFPASFGTVDLYPFVYVLPSGKLLVHSRNTTRFFDLTTETWDAAQLPAQYPFSRTYPGEGSSVLLPLLPDSDPPYRARVLVLGGGGADPEALGQFTPATNTVELLDLGEPAPSWRFTQPMAVPRVMPDATLLPDGTVLVVGGSSTGKADVGIDPVLAVELFDPVAETWTPMAPMSVPRIYHAAALLLPDARVMMVGKDGVFNAVPYDYPEHRVEIFSPPYLFKGPRPSISSAPSIITYGSAFQVQSLDAPNVASAVLVRPGSVTHSFNMEQRVVGLAISSQSSNTLTLEAPPNPHVAPPGYYLLFLLNDSGVPSVATFLRLV